VLAWELNTRRRDAPPTQPHQEPTATETLRSASADVARKTGASDQARHTRPIPAPCWSPLPQAGHAERPLRAARRPRPGTHL
jgi:hypothetical protein